MITEKCMCVCVRALHVHVRVCVTAPHDDRIAFNAWHDEKSDIIFPSAKQVGKKSEEFVNVTCASNNIFVNTAVD